MKYNFKASFKRKLLMIILVFILLGIIIYSKIENKVKIPSNIYTQELQQTDKSVIKNTTKTLRANNSSFNYITQMLEKIKFKYQILNAQNDSSNIGEDILKIEKELNENKILIENDDEAYNKTINSLEKINKTIDIAFYDLGIELIDGQFKTIEFEVLEIDDNIITCQNGTDIYEIDTKTLPFEMEFEVGENLMAYYSSLIFEDNIGKIFVFYVEKI